MASLKCVTFLASELEHVENDIPFFQDIQYTVTLIRDDINSVFEMGQNRCSAIFLRLICHLRLICRIHQRNGTVLFSLLTSFKTAVNSSSYSSENVLKMVEHISHYFPWIEQVS